MGGCRGPAIAWSLYVHLALRPEGPPGNSPGLTSGVRELDGISAEGAALSRPRVMKYRAFGARFSTTLIPALRPGLFTAGPSGLVGIHAQWVAGLNPQRHVWGTARTKLGDLPIDIRQEAYPLSSG